MSLLEEIGRGLNGPRDRVVLGAPSRLFVISTGPSPVVARMPMPEVIGRDEGLYLEKLNANLAPQASFSLDGLVLAMAGRGGAAVWYLTTPLTTITQVGGSSSILFPQLPVILARDVEQAAALQGFAVPLAQPYDLLFILDYPNVGNLAIRFFGSVRRVSGLQEG